LASWTARRERLKALGVNGNGMGTPLAIAVALLPTPNATDAEGGPRAVPETCTHDGLDHGPRLRDVAPTLLPTPTSRDYNSPHHPAGGGMNLRTTVALPPAAPRAEQWQAAIARWERICGRPAPAPTEPGRKGQPRLSPGFSEWMMGLPAGWVTDVPGLSRKAQLEAIGNGVMPAQAALAILTLVEQ
jgi:DNA (cytosine-5)-methyltransferase 1